ncbi:Uncharacterised protein [Legionella pneumophila]|nr:Uncharacterised protein [Legionella pneumophila]
MLSPSEQKIITGTLMFLKSRLLPDCPKGILPWTSLLPINKLSIIPLISFTFKREKPPHHRSKFKNRISSLSRLAKRL